MEALSPRSTNIQIKAHPVNEKGKAGAEAPKTEVPRKDKEHPPPPPSWVIQPPLKAGALSEKFRSGRFLGKGGFAICYEGSRGNHKFAMKIVKARMYQQKTEEKVSSFCFRQGRGPGTASLTLWLLVPY